MFQIPVNLPLTFVNSEGPFVDLHSPNDGKILTKVQQATQRDIEVLLKQTKTIQKTMNSLRPFQRAKIIKVTAALIQDQSESIAFIIASEGGKPLKDARIEVSRAISTLELCAEEALRLHGEVIPMERTAAGEGHMAFTIRDPIGPVLAISAFNHPLNLICHQVGCAIAAGCSVVLKPASSTPISAYFLLKALTDSGLPIGILRIVNAPIQMVETLVSSNEFDFVSFIGSGKVGWEMRRKIAPGTRISLEHGGQAPAIVCEDADLSKVIPSLIKGSFYHAGQVCISTQRIFVHKNLYKKFLDDFTTAASKLIVGPATDENTDIGPLIRSSEVSRLKDWINEAILQGASLALGNISSGNFHQYLSATVLTNVPRECTLMKEEAFGPVVCINSYDDEEELLDYLNSNNFIFEAALFTKDISKAFKISQTISAMTFVINNHTAFRVDQMPFGGHKESGLGMGGVKYAIEEMTRIKQVIIKA